MDENVVELINEVKSNPNVISTINKELQEYSDLSLMEKSVAGEAMVVERRVFRSCLAVAGDTIYELSVENDALKNTMGPYDQRRVDTFISDRYNNDTPKQKNDIILKRLKKGVSKIRSLEGN